MGRAAQGLFDFKELLLQIYDDDPVWIVRGTPEERRRATVAMLLFWQVFGFPFSWGKGQKGQEVQWIGATLRVVNRGPHGRGVRVEVPKEKAFGLAQTATGFLDKNLVGKRDLRKFAGQTSFIAGLVPLLRPFLSGIWAALKEPVTQKGPVRPGRMRAQAEHVVWTR